MVRASQLRIDKLILKIVPIIMSCLAIAIVATYMVSALYTKYGGFSVSINKYHYVEYGLSLSETADFKKPTSDLNCQASEIITNIAGASLDAYDLGAIDGQDNGDNYLCYTFYCKNTGTETVSFNYAIVINKMTMDIEKAVRIRLITSVNGQDKTDITYARVSSNEDPNNLGSFLPEEGTTPFLTKTTVLDKRQDNFASGDIMKYTVVIWLDGDDEDCVDDIIGGEFKIDMKFNILSSEEE